MAFDIQVHTTTLITLIENTMQQGFRTRCLPSADGFYVDHADVVTGKTTAAASGGGVNFVVTVNVFVVDVDAVTAAPNDVPAGATKPVGQATITLQLSVSGTTLSLACTGVDLGAIATVLGAKASTVEQQIQQAIGTVGSLDIGSIVTKIGLPAPSTSSVEIDGASVLIRFDPSGPGQERIQAGQDWCLFADANTMVTVVETKLDSALAGVSSFITSHTTSATWTPSGATPEMTVEVTGEAQVPDPFSGHVSVGMNVVIGLIHTFVVKGGIAADLTLDVTWGLSVDLGWLFDLIVPPWVTQLVVNTLTSQLDPAKFGAIPLGPNEFEMLVSLPPLSFGAARFNYGSVVGLLDGMVLGGSVTLPPGPDMTTLSLTVQPFPDTFQLLVDCSKGGASAKATLATVTAPAAAGFYDAGEICDIHFVSPISPPIPLVPYLTAPSDGTVTESGEIGVILPGSAALSLSQNPQPVQLWFQAARGVRLIDFGTPPSPEVDDEGNVTNYHALVLNDCPWAVSPWSRIFHMYNPKWSVDPPESWTEAIDQVMRFETVLIELNGLEAGSVVRFDMPIMGLGAGSVFTADGSGRALVPAVLAARTDDEAARLSTADRQALDDVAVSTSVFQRVAVLETPGATSHQLAEMGGGAAITSTYADGRTQTMHIDALRVPRLMQAVPAGAGNLANEDAPGAGQEPGEAGIPGLVALHPVPGLESMGVQVAELDDGSYCSVVHEDGRWRATGTIPVWPHMPPSGKAWAISSSTGDRVAVFEVSRTLPESGCGALTVQDEDR